MNDTAQLDASTAADPSTGSTSAPTQDSSQSSSAPSLETSGNASEAGQDASNTPQAAGDSKPPADPNAPPTSLTTPKSVASTANNPAQPVDPALRARQEAGAWGREKQRMNSEMERMRSEMVTLQQFREEQLRKAQTAQTKRWDHQHPEQRKFDGLLERRARAQAQLAKIRSGELPEGIPPELADRWRKSQMDLVAGDFDDAERNELAEFDQFQQESVRGLTTNMPATIGKIVQPMIRETVQAMMQEHRVRQEVQRDLQDPTLKPLMERFGDEMEKAMAQGTPYDQAIHYTKVYGQYEMALEKISRLEQQISGMSGKVNAATAQQIAAQGKASIVRDVGAPQSTPFRDALKWANETGTDTDSDAFRAKVRELQAKST